VTARRYCPQCESSWIGYPVPDGACVVRVDGALSAITLAHRDLGLFLDIDDVDTTQARCLDCFHEFSAEVTK
jgi:hypothetical protein